MCNLKCRYFTAVILAVSLAAGVIRVTAAEPVAKKASAPSPKDGATDVRRDGTTLSWTPGGTTGKYDVYFGTVRKYVEAAQRVNPVYVEASSIGQKTKTFTPGRLELGQTYYWRVDEVNDVDPNDVKVVKGDVWSFMVEVPALPVTGVTATASSSNTKDQGPGKVVSGAGLSAAGKHSTEPNDMWLSAIPVVEPEEPEIPAEPNLPADPNAPVVTVDPNAPVSPVDPNAPVAPTDPNAPVTPDEPTGESDLIALSEPDNPVEAPVTWIQFRFAKIHKLYEMSIWNWNAADSLDYGVKGITVQYSTNGTDWTTLGDFELAQGTGKADYACNNVISLAGIAATDVKLIINSGYGASGAYGLSEVKFSAVPVFAREPSPASGAKNVAIDGTLNWRIGRDAASHKVFIGTDKAAVEKGTAQSFTVKTNSFKLTSLEVQLQKTYYWRVDEVNDVMSPKSFAGDIWSFTAADYVVVDDFESYKDNLAPSWIVGSASTLEKSIARAGKQSLLMNYGKSLASPRTMVTRSLTSQKDWTKNGITTLVLFLGGDFSNTNTTLSLRINDGDWLDYAGGTRNPWWGCWTIDLVPLKSKLKSVDSITIGLDVPSKGKLYIDDIRLYGTTPPAPDIVKQVVTLNGAGDLKGQFDTLIAALSAVDASLPRMLSSETAYTLFAPTNAAFTAAGISAKTDQAILNDVLRNHIIAKNVSATNKGSLKTLEGSALIQDANMVTDDLGGTATITASANVSNGVVHTVDAVLMPFSLTKIVDILNAMNKDGEYAGQFDTLLAGIAAAKATVRDTLGKRHNTLFAPTDDAFAALGYDPDTIKKLDQSLLTEILLYHVASGRTMGKDLAASIKTVQGGTLKQSKGKLTDAIGGVATITGFDIEGSNGVIHITDAVAMPFAKTRLLDIVAVIVALNREGDLAGQVDTLIAAAEKADPAVLGTLAGEGPYTIFAPNDEAFAALDLAPDNVGGLDRVYLGDILLYHAVAAKLSAKDALAAQEIKTVQGGVIMPDPNGLLVGAFAGAARITTQDIEAHNGLVHVVDAVLLPYEYVTPVVPEPEPVQLDILGTVIALNAAGDYADQFDTFLAVVGVDQAVLDVLSGAAPHTLFIPTDDAFAALEPKIGSLNKTVVKDILLYHLAPGKLLAADVLAVESIAMLKGGSLQQADGVLTDNTGGKAKIVEQDISASNGVIHVIDAVMLPAKL